MSDEVELALLKAKVIEIEENQDALIQEFGVVKSNLKVGKGFLIGITFTLGAFGILAFDKAHEFVVRVLKVIN